MEQTDLLRLVGDVLEAGGIRYGFTGSHASSVYGEVRFTNDIDVVAEINRLALLEKFLQAFPSPDFYVSEIGAAQAVRAGGQFNIIHAESSQKVDVIIPADPAWPDELARRRQIPLADGRPAWFISPEDLILHKMSFYREGGSEKHLRDIASVLRVGGADIDRAYIGNWAERLGLGDIWKHIVSKVGS